MKKTKIEFEQWLDRQPYKPVQILWAQKAYRDGFNAGQRAERRKIKAKRKG